MNEHEKIKELIKFLKENNIGLSSEEITSTCCDFLSYYNNSINDLKDIFEGIFGEKIFTKPEKNLDIKFNLIVSLEDFYYGITKKILNSLQIK